MDGAEMLRNIFQFEKSHSGFTWRGTVAAMRILLLKRRERALNYRACGQSMISAGINTAPSRKAFACGATHQTRPRHISLHISVDSSGVRIILVNR
jgi:hypothetical protein